MNELRKLFIKVGGKQIIHQYLYAHVFLYAVFVTIIMGLSRKSLEIVRLAVSNKVLTKLRKRYKRFIQNYIKNNDKILDLPRYKANKVWICWLQGIEKAPDVVRLCYASLCENLKDKEIVLINENNYREWITFPEYIQTKVDEGIITNAHLSDLIRLELLNKYGGTWIDATVYCSGNNYSSFIFESELFMYQNMKPGLDGHAFRTSNWFITASTNQPIMKLTQALLYEYWKNNDKLVDYFIFHQLLELAIENYCDEWKKVVPVNNSIPHILLLRFGEKYDEKLWNATKEMTAFHKLSYRFTDEQIQEMNKKGSFYDVIIKANIE